MTRRPYSLRRLTITSTLCKLVLTQWLDENEVEYTCNKLIGRVNLHCLYVTIEDLELTGKANEFHMLCDKYLFEGKRVYGDYTDIDSGKLWEKVIHDARWHNETYPADAKLISHFQKHYTLTLKKQ